MIRLMAVDRAVPISPAEAAALFYDLQKLPAAVLSVSGGPDSTALMWLAARWRKSLARGPKLIAVTVDHGIRTDSAAEARVVAKLARNLGIPHRTLRWTGKKPSTGLQEAARAARYRLLAEAARKAGASAILTAHTLDDQAETVLIRLTRGSGLTGLAGMRRSRSMPEPVSGLRLDRPLLSVPKSRLIATLEAEHVPFAQDPSNADPRFMRARLRRLMPKLAEEGLDARRLALLAARLARAEEALSLLAQQLYETMARQSGRRTSFPAADLLELMPGELSLRLLGRAIDERGDEGPVELGKLEALHFATKAAFESKARFRRTLAGAVVTLNPPSLTVEPAPPRRSRRLTTARKGKRTGRKKR
jgi:tRNA(Ile)-lysidine synthase